MAWWVASLFAERGVAAHVGQREVQAGGRDGERTYAVLRDYLDGLCGTARAPQVDAQVLFRLRSQAQTMDLVKFAVELASPGLQQLCEHLQRFVEPPARLVLVYPQASVLAAAQPAAHTACDVASRSEERVQHVYVLGDAYRIVPGQHRDHRAQVNVPGDAGDIGKVLKRVCDHRVWREVMLDGPDRIESTRIRDARDVEFLVEDLTVRTRRPPGHGFALFLRLVPVPVGVVLIEDRRPNSHFVTFSTIRSREIYFWSARPRHRIESAARSPPHCILLPGESCACALRIRVERAVSASRSRRRRSGCSRFQQRPDPGTRNSRSRRIRASADRAPLPRGSGAVTT